MSLDILEPVRVPSCYRDETGHTHQTIEGAREANRIIKLAALFANTDDDLLNLKEPPVAVSRAIAQILVTHKKAIIELLNA